MKTINKVKLVGLASLITTNSLFAQTFSAADFGELLNYSAVVTDEMKVKEATYAGNIGLVSGSELKLEDDGVINGNIFLASGASTDLDGVLNGSIITGAAVNSSLSSAANMFSSLQTKLDGLTVNGGTFSGDGSKVHNAVADVTVIRYDGGMKLEGETITLNGNASFANIFVFKTDDFETKDGTNVILNGVSASNIIWYSDDNKLTINHDKGDSSGPNSFSGILFAPEAKAKVGGGGIFNGAVYAEEIDIGSGARFTSVVPEPSSTALLGLGAVGFILRRKR